MTPGPPAILGLVDSLLPGMAPEMPLGGHIGHIGVGGMGEDLTDVVRIPEPHVDEGLPAVGGLVDPVTPGHRVPGAGLARTDPDDVRVRLEDGDVADIPAPVVLEDRLPGGPGVVGEPRPPEAAPTITRAGVGSTASMSVTRPAMLAGPMFLHWRSPLRFGYGLGGQAREKQERKKREEPMHGRR